MTTTSTTITAGLSTLRHAPAATLTGKGDREMGANATLCGARAFRHTRHEDARPVDCSKCAAKLGR